MRLSKVIWERELLLLGGLRVLLRWRLLLLLGRRARASTGARIRQLSRG